MVGKAVEAVEVTFRTLIPARIRSKGTVHRIKAATRVHPKRTPVPSKNRREKVTLTEA